MSLFIETTKSTWWQFCELPESKEKMKFPIMGDEIITQYSALKLFSSLRHYWPGELLILSSVPSQKCVHMLLRKQANYQIIKWTIYKVVMFLKREKQKPNSNALTFSSIEICWVLKGGKGTKKKETLWQYNSWDCPLQKQKGQQIKSPK